MRLFYGSHIDASPGGQNLTGRLRKLNTQPNMAAIGEPREKGKVERKFFYVESSLLNGRTFDTLEHLNEVTAWWLANVADTHVLVDFTEAPRDRH